MLRLVNYGILIVCVALIALTMLQSKGGGLSTVFGGSGNVYQTRRGFEKWMFATTIILTIVFVVLSLSAVFLQK